MDDNKLSEIAIRVSRYFRDFLQSDFKRAQAPRRRIVLTSDTGFRAGMRTAPYPALDRDLWALLSKPTGDDLTLPMTPRRYTRPVSASLRKVIQEQIHAMPETALVSVRNAVIEFAQKTYTSAIENPEQWIDSVQEELAKEVGAQVIRPLVAHLDGPLREQAYSVMDSLLAAESDLIARVCGDLNRVLPEVLAKLLATSEDAALVDASKNFLNMEALHAGLLAFFENFVAADAYLEFRDIETYVATGDSMQLYLYLGALKYRNAQYPLFFVPIHVTRSDDGTGYSLKIVNHLYANRSAIDFVLQELGAGLKREWVSPITERITYVTPQQSIFEVVRTLFRKVANATDLGGQIDFSSAASEATTASVSLSSALHLAAYERSDEALINDYEEIIDQFNRGGSNVANLFKGLVEGVLMGNEASIRGDVEDEWENLPLVERMVFDSPIPLNEEQRKVLLAVRNANGKIVVVEGPPGTGKSHTITAIAADCAFNNKSCLVLSDKTEALDVVVSKLSEAMSRVRHDRDFPNPILRLGQQNANFRKLTSNATVTQIGAYAKATRANREALDAERELRTADLKESIGKTVEVLGEVRIAALQQMHQHEFELAARAPNILGEIHKVTDSSLLPELAAIVEKCDALQQYLAQLIDDGADDATTLREWVRLDACMSATAPRAESASWNLFDKLTPEQVRAIQDLLVKYQHLRAPLFGYLFRGAKVRELEERLNQLPTNRPLFFKQDAVALNDLVAGANLLQRALEAEKLDGHFELAYQRLARGEAASPTSALALKAFSTAEKANPAIFDALMAQPKADANLLVLAIVFLREWLETHAAFAKAPDFDYVGTKYMLERLNTSIMNSHVDTRLIKFMDEHRADARALAGVIANGQKFPEEKFASVRNSFPVIVASIREFGEFMPLAPDLFDVVVIDEASQVSVAQALPALLRAKKVVVLGDSKQFSNVKSSNASIAMNDKYRADLVNHFRSEVSDKADALERLSMFDVKRSILEFCNLGASYSVMLRKHFRSYKELIGYSSSTFYGHQLQAIKIRGVPVDEVIQFDEVDTGDFRCTRGVNEAEANFILERLLELIEEEDPPTVGVITPFREQQTFLSKLLFGHARGREFEDILRLKVMTFDSCQGEERNIIMYSMVATPGNDALNFIFPVALENAQESVEDKLKVQRLNVGFSRAQEMVWIVHSMPLSEYRGAIGQALNYYVNTLERGAPSADQTDASSPMEAKVLDWLQQTPFLQEHQDEIEIIPQFPVGDYLRQLDPTYEHPAWRVDFLLIYRSEKGPLHIVIEYDGFEFHFQKGRQVHVGNHQRYLNGADVERQLTLESYGYRFLRINRFNLGADPILTLSGRLVDLVEMALGEAVSESVVDLQTQAAGLASKEMRACSRCEEILPLADFYDSALKSGQGGYGRVCMPCKATDSKPRSTGRGKRRWKSTKARGYRRWA
ncbi:hypothetical protein LMG18090_00821 [Ralstonia mannitolilytica]|uniref:AAA domain-containing protein n=1 Tax=Ralstonia TaxID=48736 RepID=UPI00046A737D|nr:MULTISPECIES: AAA domain-containing protein [Ralstonia]CAJ0777464.1 hypothetical protein LMG18090_00821 [Ralstonia mannitolilytica]